MHMHWKFHETVQVDCHIYKHEDVKAVARKLALLSGGIVIDIHQATNIIMYRGRNYKQPKKEMIPPNTLTKRKALFKSKYIQALESLNELIQNIESELQTIRRKQKQNTEQGAESDKVQLLEIADDQTEDLLAKLSDISSNSEDEDGDDGIFSWDSDSLDEDELSDVSESITRKGEVHEKQHTRSEFSRTGDSVAHNRKKNRPTVRELILAEQQLFKERGSGMKLESLHLDDGLQTDNDDDHISHASTKGDHPLKASDTKKQKSGRIKNRKIASFVEDLTSDSDAFEKLDSDFDG
ncbi:hypothetical protein KP509_01G126500 [Ceratopteris richardii]|nr:hypothetical protein KP509_01G126500 [Ceratopteris richardii]